MGNLLQGSAAVTIYVQDVNDHVPSLSGTKFEYILTENILQTFTPTISVINSILALSLSLSLMFAITKFTCICMSSSCP